MLGLKAHCWSAPHLERVHLSSPTNLHCMLEVISSTPQESSILFLCLATLSTAHTQS